MYYSIRHLTKFLYTNPVSESMMETRMHPRSDAEPALPHLPSLRQPALPRLLLPRPPRQPRPSLRHPRPARQLVIVAESLVEVQPASRSPPSSRPTPGPNSTTSSHRATTGRCSSPASSAPPPRPRRTSPTTSTSAAATTPSWSSTSSTSSIYNYFDYVPKSTKVDSPIDVALNTRKGVCQDFAHIMITLVRSKLRIPCRYVSGYLSHGEHASTDRSAPPPPTPGSRSSSRSFGWVGFDPTNRLVAGDRHIRTAIGRDYADVPPTHGMFRGRAKSELTVAVRVTPAKAPLTRPGTPRPRRLVHPRRKSPGPPRTTPRP